MDSYKKVMYMKEKIIGYYENRMSIEDIAKIVEISEGAVREAIEAYEQVRDAKSQAVIINPIIRYWDMGATIEAISVKTGINYNRVGEILKQAGRAKTDKEGEYIQEEQYVHEIGLAKSISGSGKLTEKYHAKWIPHNILEQCLATMQSGQKPLESILLIESELDHQFNIRISREDLANSVRDYERETRQREDGTVKQEKPEAKVLEI